MFSVKPNKINTLTHDPEGNLMTNKIRNLVYIGLAVILSFQAVSAQSDRDAAAASAVALDMAYIPVAANASLRPAWATRPANTAAVRGE